MRYKGNNHIARVLSMLSFLFTLAGSAQTDNPGVEVAKMDFKAKQVIPPSPDAAELGKYGNTPVSLFTGTPNISIPFFELKGNSLSMPVSLSYNAGGFKPEEIAPWTGLGWSLSAGGVITRSVQGNPDIPSNYYTTDPFTLPVSGDPISMAIYYASLRDCTKETQPDTYYYNFMGHSGKFFISPAGAVLCKEKNMLAIFDCSTCNPGSFTITDENGNVFQFAELETTRMIPSDEAGSTVYTTYNFTSSWYLSSVTSADGVETLQFEYHAPSAEQSLLQNALNNQSQTNQITYNTFSYTNNINLVESAVPATFVKRKFLKKVSLLRNAKLISYIDFESGMNERQDLWLANFNGERILKKIKLYNYFNGAATLTREFELGFGYFSPVHNLNGERRLRLETVKENPVVEGTPPKPPYQLFYNPGDVPGRYSPGIDHWGYYNGAGNNFLGIPNIIPTVASAGYSIPNGNYGRGADRQPNAVYCAIGILNKIVYPTGGYTLFEYEGHDAKFETSYATVGGLRIKKITDYSCESDKASEKEYSYSMENGETSGRIGALPRYDNYSQHDGSECSLAEFKTSHTMTISANSIFPLGSFQGSHIGYSRVEERQKDVVTGQSLGKTVYKYHVGLFSRYDDDIGNGDLLETTMYDNSGKLVKEVKNEYQYGINGTLTIRSLWPAMSQNTKLALCKQSGTGLYVYYDPLCASYNCDQFVLEATRYLINDYTLNLQDKKLLATTEKIYDQSVNTYLVNEKKFSYGSNHIYPLRIEQKSTGAEVVVTEKKYAADYVTAGAADNEAASIDLLQNKNILGAEIESVQYRQNQDGSNRRYINGLLTLYKASKPYPEKLYRLEMTSPIAGFQWSAIANGVFSKDAHYALSGSFAYNDMGNLIEQSKANDVITSYVWGYDNSYPVAQITGASYAAAVGATINDAVLQNPSSDEVLRSELGKIKTNVPGALVNLLTYKPGFGVTSQTDQRGRTTYFDYDGFARLVNVKDHDGNIVKNIRYNYASGTCITPSPQTLFYNEAISQTFIKADGCPTGAVPTTVAYTVPYGRYAAATQAAANASALADINANGQANANTNGQCLFYNTMQSQWFTKNDCPYEQGPGNLMRYIIIAGLYSSPVDQATADNLALAQIATYGQAVTNASVTCSCSAEGKRFINGVCETGTLVQYASESLPNGQWRCTYYYTFSDGFNSAHYYTIQNVSCPVSN